MIFPSRPALRSWLMLALTALTSACTMPVRTAMAHPTRYFLTTWEGTTAPGGIVASAPAVPSAAPVLASTTPPPPNVVQHSGVVAVLPLDTNSTQIDASTKLALDETVRSFVGDALSTYGFTVLDSDKTLAYLSDNGIDANKVCGASCALAAARELKATLFVSGTIARTEGDFVALIRLSDARSGAGRMLGVVQLEGSSVKEIRKSFQSQVRQFVANAVAKLE